MYTLVGQQAPAFKTKAVIPGKIMEDFSLQDFLGQYVLFYFYPLDFTFVCPTELHAFQERLNDFQQRNCQVVGCSVDSAFSHLAWLDTPKERGGIQGVQYPLVADLTKQIAADFGVLNPEEGVSFRGQFLIDRQGIIRHALVNDLPIGRSVDEALRLLDAWIFHEKHGEVCPANWQKGEKSMKPSQEGLTSYFSN